MYTNKYIKAFSLVEFLIAIAIAIIVMIAIYKPVKSYLNEKALDNSVQQVMATLLKAKTDTLSLKDNQQYGVHFEPGKMVIFQGAYYVDGAPTNEIKYLEDNITISSSKTLDDLIFERLTGAPAMLSVALALLVIDGIDIVVTRATSDGLMSKTIYIEETGLIRIMD